MSIGEDDPAALIDDEAGGIASTSGLSVKSTTGGCPQNDDGGDDLAERLSPVVGGGGVFFERRIDLHGEFVLDVRFAPYGLRSQPLQRIGHSNSVAESGNRERNGDFWGEGNNLGFVKRMAARLVKIKERVFLLVKVGASLSWVCDGKCQQTKVQTCPEWLFTRGRKI